MLHGMIRAATAALLFVIAILVYINYFRASDSILPEHSDVASAPEVPKVPVSPEPVPASPQEQATPPAMPAPLTATAPIPAPAVPAHSRAQRAEIVDDGTIADVVELPPSNRARAITVAASVQAPAAKPTGKRTHVVQPGESLWVISRKYLGNGELNAKIAECNGLTSRDHIRAGQVLVIPDLNAPAVAIQAPARTVRVSEDLADDDDARRVTKTSHKSESNVPAAMNVSAQDKF